MRKTIAELLKQEHHPLLIAHAMRKDKEFVYAHPEYKLNLFEFLRLKYYQCLFNKGYSIAVITRHKEFCGLDFYVNKHVLVPRPETEIMVELAIAQIRQINIQYPISNILVIDVGTGTGCIPISIISAIGESAYGGKIIATDISRKALRVAKKNARKHNADIIFLRGNLLEPIANNSSLFTFHFSLIIITANLPYLTESQFQSEPSIKREPKIALVAEKQGLGLYGKLLKQISDFQRQYPISNIQYSIFFEIDPSQSKHIVPLIRQYLPNANVEIKTDLAGRDRIIVASIAK